MHSVARRVDVDSKTLGWRKPMLTTWPSFLPGAFVSLRCRVAWQQVKVYEQTSHFFVLFFPQHLHLQYHYQVRRPACLFRSNKCTIDHLIAHHHQHHQQQQVSTQTSRWVAEADMWVAPTTSTTPTPPSYACLLPFVLPLQDAVII